MPEHIQTLLKTASSAIITTHTRPDGDAIGSQLALGLFLEKSGKSVRLINHDRPPFTLDWMPGAEKLEVFDGSISQREAISSADVLIVVDTNTEDRLGDVGASVRAAPGTKLLIDHHTQPETWFDANLVEESASSTGELIYHLISDWNIDAIDNAIATALYVAVMTDTGSFRFSNVTGKVHRLIADLIDRGQLDASQIHANIFDRRSPEGLRLLSRVLSTLEVHHDGQIGSMVISRRALAETGAGIEEAEGFVNQILTVEGVRAALLFTETERGTKVSFRSKGDAHVHRWAHVLGGGGHRNASGAFVKKGLEETMRMVIDKAPKYITLHHPDKAGEGDLPAEDAAYLSSLLNLQPRGSDE